MRIAGRSPESSTHLRSSLEMVATTLVFSPVPARAPVCVTESSPLISQGLAFRPLLLLPSQPTICTLLTNLNLNKMGKKDILRGHLMAFSFVRCDKGCNGLYYKMVQKANGSQSSLPKCLDTGIQKLQGTSVCSLNNLTLRKRISANVARYESHF